MKLKTILEGNTSTDGLYNFDIKPNTNPLKAYHGTDFLTKDGNKFKLPLWITSRYGLASHFALRPSSSSKTVSKGYIYILEISNPKIKKIEDDRFVLSSGKIKILEIITVKPHPLTSSQIVDRKKL